MSTISKVSSLIDGSQETVDLSTNTLTVGDILVGGKSLSQVAIPATFGGVIPGTSTSVSLEANFAGTMGNSIALVFTGSNTISAEIATWNAAHLSNMVTLTSGNGTQVPSAQTLNLSNGVDSASSIIGDTSTYVNFTATSPTVSGALAGIDAALASVGGDTQKVDKFTLSGTDITNKFVNLAFTPLTAGNTILLVEDAGNMFYGVDFTVTGNQLGWNGLSLDGILSSGDKLTIVYNT